MQSDELIESAQKPTGLDTFDSDSFREPLEFMIRCIDQRSQRENIYACLGPEMLDGLANRLRVADYLRRHPELEDAPIEAPIIVMGMPRTGTTAVSYLLDCDRRRRSLLNWEAVDSVPPATTATLRTDPRCVEKKRMQEEILPNLPSRPLTGSGPTDRPSASSCRHRTSRRSAGSRASPAGTTPTTCSTVT